MSSSVNPLKTRIFEAARRLKPMPNSVTRVLRAVEDPETSIGNIANFISMDQVLTAEVLKVANSALLGYGRTCGSINEAAVRLGMKRIKLITLGVGAADSMSGSLRGYSLGGGDMMRHAVSTGTIALWLAQALIVPNPDEVYVAGLLHDIGKLLLDQYLLKDREHLMKLLQTSKQPLWEIEERLFSIHHAEAGGLIAKHWRFPLSLVDAIESHHRPDQAKKDHTISAVVNLANAFSPNDSVRSDFLEGRFVHESSLEILNLNPEMLENLKKECNAAMKIGAAVA
ncbi:MAG: HDOD domain-containing protein [Anaerolineales bacterium]|nr:HDOD domain-containing protein [Anaerolineales bacterium]